jgi:hypothetical protein
VRGFGRRGISETSEPPHPDPLPHGEKEKKAGGARAMIITAAAAMENRNVGANELDVAD